MRQGPYLEKSYLEFEINALGSMEHLKNFPFISP